MKGADDALPGCIHCGSPGRQICDPCFETVCDIAEANRRRFQKLLAAGVDREMANRIMIAMIDGGPPS